MRFRKPPADWPLYRGGLFPIGQSSVTTLTSFPFLSFYFIFFIFKVYLFLRERERARVRNPGRGRESGRERIPSRLHLVSAEPDSGLGLTNLDVET